MTRLVVAVLATLFLALDAFGCSLCSMSVPTISVGINVVGESDRIRYADIVWEFSEEFTRTVMQTHDTNKNGLLEGDELRNINRFLLEYIAPKSFLTHIDSFIGDSVNNKNISFKIDSQKLIFDANKLVFSYRLLLDIKTQNDMTLSFVFDDEGEYFMFSTKPESTALTLPSEWKSEINAYSNIAIFGVYSQEGFAKRQEEKSTQPGSAALEQNAKIERQDDSRILNIARAAIVDLSAKINAHLVSVKQDGSLVAYFSLLFFSFVYGVLHAMGPGHGKSLVAAYFMANERSYVRAAAMSAMIGVTHTFSAFVLTIVAYFAFGLFFGGFVTDVGVWTTKISAVIIITVALYLGYKRVPKKKLSHWKTHPNECLCRSCKVGGEGGDMGVVLAAGLVPCPGTVGIFMFAISLGMFFVGFMAALAMSMGMSLVILLSSVITIKVRKSSENRYAKLALYLNFAAIFVMICLGVLLLLV